MRRAGGLLRRGMKSSPSERSGTCGREGATFSPGTRPPLWHLLSARHIGRATASTCSARTPTGALSSTRLLNQCLWAPQCLPSGTAQRARYLTKSGSHRSRRTAQQSSTTPSRTYNGCAAQRCARQHSKRAKQLTHCRAARCSPCLKLKPVSKGAKCGFRMLNVETYGGGLWHTWFDRDLSVAGRALLREGDRLVHRLVRAPGASPCIPA